MTRRDEPTAGLEIDEESGEEIERRAEWFMAQRAYPSDAPPPTARRRAWATRPKIVKGDGYDPLLNTAAATGAPIWRPIGPAPTTPAFPSNWGYTSGRVNAVAVSPVDPQLLLVGAATGGIWRSTDGGANFTPTSDTQVDLAIGSIAFSRSNPQIVYAGMGDFYSNSYFGTGVLRSNDAGRTWTRVNVAGLPALGTTSKIEVDPTNANRVYLVQYLQYNAGCLNSSCSSGVYVSNDGGATWTRTFAGLVRDLAISLVNPQVIYIGVRRNEQLIHELPGLYRSLDGGSTWLRVLTLNTFFIDYSDTTRVDLRIATTPAAPNTIYILTGNTIAESGLRIEMSTDGGLTWTTRSTAGIDPGQFGYNAYIQVDPTNPSILYVGTRDVFKSVDGGASWFSLTRNFVAPYNCNNCYQPTGSLSHPDQHSFAFDPTNPNIFYIGNDGGLSKTTNGGASFQSLNATLALTQFVGLAMHPTDPTRTYGGTQDNGTQFRTGANGWQEFAPGDGGHVVVNAPDPSIVFSTYVEGSIRRWRFNNTGGRTNDLNTSNATFGESASGARINFYAPFTTSGVDQRLFFGTWRLFASNDLGASWAALGGSVDLTKGLADPANNRPSDDVLSAIGVERRAGAQVIYTGSAQGCVRGTTNGGQTWSPTCLAGLPDRYVSEIKIDPQNGSVAYLAMSGFDSGHVFKTVNFGQTWTDISGNLPNIPANAVQLDPLTPTTLYVATDIGVFRSLAGGITWETFNTGLPPTIVTGFAANTSGQIQIGTYGRGAYELNFDGPVPTPTPTPTPTPSGTVQFSAPTYTFAEDAGQVVINVARSSDSVGTVMVDFATVDDGADVSCADTQTKPGTAFARCDYATTVDTLTFAPGEFVKTIAIPLIDDAYVEGSESVQLQLTNPLGATLGARANATLVINDNDAPGQPNPIWGRAFFVRQHYLDFLSREPDQSGFDAWTGVLNRCPDEFNVDPNNAASAACDRLTVSASFFGSQEFQLKGFYVFRFYKVAYGASGDTPDYVPAYAEVISDMRAVTGQTSQEVFAKKAIYANLFTQRAGFNALYGGLSHDAYVAALMGRYNLPAITTPDPQQPDAAPRITLTRAELVARLTDGRMTRGQVLRAIADSTEVFNTEYNSAFVAMQYYGYLRRTPDAAGYRAWLNALQRGESFRTMVNGFMNSTEYRLRFGTP
jgi:photosystem II stability/assembly factor-like uncharacterized protein